MRSEARRKIFGLFSLKIAYFSIKTHAENRLPSEARQFFGVLILKRPKNGSNLAIFQAAKICEAAVTI